MHRMFDIGKTFNVQEGFLLPSEGGIGKVFRRGGAAHGYFEAWMLRLELFVGIAKRGFKARRQRCINDPLANRFSCLSQCFDIIDI